MNKHFVFYLLLMSSSIFAADNSSQQKLDQDFAEAVFDAEYEKAKTLLAAKANIDNLEHDRTPLMTAARYVSFPQIKFLCEQGANKAVKNSDDETALDIYKTFSSLQTRGRRKSSRIKDIYKKMQLKDRPLYKLLDPSTSNTDGIKAAESALDVMQRIADDHAAASKGTTLKGSSETKKDSEKSE